MAFECPVIIYTLAAFSSAHLALRDEQFQVVSLRHRGLALQELKRSVDSKMLSKEAFLAVTMIMCSMDSISEATDSWIHHLSAASSMLRSSRDSHAGIDDTTNLANANTVLSLRSSFEGKWLLRNFAYHDILMSVSMDCRPSISGFYWLSTDDDVDDTADTYFGFAGRVLYLVGEISHLGADLKASTATKAQRQNHFANDDASETIASRLHTYTDSGYPLMEDILGGQEWPSSGAHSHFAQRAQTIELYLQEWTNPSPESESALAMLGEAYRHAALIYLYWVLRRHYAVYSAEAIQPKMLTSVRAICNAARSMPLGSLAECTMLFPLFMAGGEAEDDADIQIIRQRLLSMNQWRKFRNVEACLRVLDEVWRLRSAGTRRTDLAKVDWLDIAQLRGWKIALT